MKKAVSLKMTGLTAAALLLAGLGMNITARDKNFYFPEVRINVAIQPDGSFTVDEYRTYEFHGSFSWASLWIPLEVRRKGYDYRVTLDDFEIRDQDGRELRAEISGGRSRFEARWSYRADNELRTFHIHYRIRGGIFSYRDVSEFYWQLIGTGWDRPTRKVTAVVKLPRDVPAVQDILVYGHGPLSGRADRVDRSTARFTAENLPGGQFFEVRVVWPTGMVSGLPSDRYDRASIIAEEARFVEETIARAEAARASRERKEKLKRALIYVWLVWLAVGPLFWLYFYLRSWKRFGRDYRFDDIPEYMREPPSELEPALVEILVREGSPITPRAFTATLFDLARRGWIGMEDRVVEKRGIFGSRQDYATTLTLKRDPAEDKKLEVFEADFLRLLFSRVEGGSAVRGDRLEMDDLKLWFKKNPRSFQSWFRRWQKKVKTRSEEFDFLEPEGTRRSKLFFGLGLALGALGANPILLVVAAVLSPRMKRRRRNWARENELWKAMERFLDDFGDFKETPPEAYKLWEFYLVFGILFGKAKKILKLLPEIVADQKAAAPAWYAGMGTALLADPGQMTSIISRIESMAASIEQASTSAAHYSSGGGGGFSSGGGGGGGGGGGSAG